jgi:LemA protein
MTSWTIILLVVAAMAVWTGVIYNRLVGLRNRAASSWSDIEVQLKRRHDLVGNLVETVKGYAAHERRTLEELAAARSRATGAEQAGPREASAAESVLTTRLQPVFALAEAYPDLKASRGYQDLHHSLIELEDDIQNARRYYNAVVRDLNTRIQSIPDVLVARPLGFGEGDYFHLSDSSEAGVPDVRL